jgi:hypothetical protein
MRPAKGNFFAILDLIFVKAGEAKQGETQNGAALGDYHPAGAARTCRRRDQMRSSGDRGADCNASARSAETAASFRLA